MSKKRAIFTIVTGCIAVVVLSGVLLVGLRNDGFGFLRASAREEGQPFGNEYQLEFDPAEDPVEELHIDWEAGPVQVKAGEPGRIRVVETCRAALSEEEHMAVQINRKNLEIKWDHNRFRFLSFLPFFAEHEKGLVVELPPDVLENLTEVECSNVSGGIEVLGAVCQEGEFSSVSGSITLEGVACADICDASTTSGDVVAKELTAGQLNASTTSGTLSFEGVEVAEADCSSVSGEMTFLGRAGDFHHSSISGVSHAEFSACPEELDMSSVSGQITVALPPDACFHAEHSSVSGEFGCDFPGSGESYGSGKAQGDFQFSTTSGDILIVRN